MTIFAVFCLYSNCEKQRKKQDTEDLTPNMKIAFKVSALIILLSPYSPCIYLTDHIFTVQHLQYIDGVKFDKIKLCGAA